MSTTSPDADASTTAEARALKDGIAELYDQSSGLWEDIWGDHMHHGFYDPDSNVSASDHRAAQIRMIEESLCFAGISGSSLYTASAPYIFYNSRVGLLLESYFGWVVDLQKWIRSCLSEKRKRI